VLPHSCAAEIFAEHNHFQFEIGGDAWRLGPWDADAEVFAFQNAGAKISGNELKFVGRQAKQETTSVQLLGPIGTRNKGGYQSVSHGRSPVGEEPY
jgi:hypothetical protein